MITPQAEAVREWRFEMAWDIVIANEIRMNFTQMQIAKTYHLALFAKTRGAEIDFPSINRAILSKWKMSGLERIKKRAWDLLAGKRLPEPPK